MAAPVSSLGTVGRQGTPFNNVSFIPVTLTLVTSTYNTAAGGLVIDLTIPLQQAATAGGVAPNYVQALHPADVVGIQPIQMSSGTMGTFLPLTLAMGTPTYTATPWQTAANASASPGALLTCPATIRLYGTGSGAAAAFAEIADAVSTYSGTISFWLIVMRNGANS